MLAQVLSTAAPPTLDCLLGTVLPAVVARISSRNGTGAVSAFHETGSSSSHGSNNVHRLTSGEAGARGATSAPRSSSSRDTAAIHAICRLAASVAASSVTARGERNRGADPVQFRDKLSGSELRKLGPLGREAEVALAEAFFYREAEGAAC